MAAVCHGPAALVDVRLSDGSYLVAGKRVAAFTDEDKRSVGLDAVVPFLLAARLSERGALHTGAANFQAYVVRDGRLVTGQNSASATGTAEAVVSALREAGSQESVGVEVSLTARGGEREALVRHLQQNLPDTRASEGCRNLELYIDQDDPDLVSFSMRWDSRERYEAYLAWRASTGALDALGTFLASAPTIRYMSRVPLVSNEPVGAH